jgi:hypothetical protein
MGPNDRIRVPQQRDAARGRAAKEKRETGPLELAGALGNSAMQQIARSRSLRSSPAVVGLLARAPATYARSRLDDEDEGLGLGTGTAMEDWLWEMQGWAEQQKAKQDAGERWIIEHADDWSWGNDGYMSDEELAALRRRP